MAYVRAFRAAQISGSDRNTAYGILLDDGADDPNDKRELVIIRSEYARIAFFRDQTWHVSGRAESGKTICLWQEE